MLEFILKSLAQIALYWQENVAGYVSRKVNRVEMIYSK